MTTRRLVALFAVGATMMTVDMSTATAAENNGGGVRSADSKAMAIGLIMRFPSTPPHLATLLPAAKDAMSREDPYRYRRNLLTGNPRAPAVLDAVAGKSGWATPPPQGRHRGIAFCEAFRTFIAHVVELSVSPQGAVTLHRVVAAVDPGTVLDPGITPNAIEGGVTWALSCAFKSEITFDRGRTVQSNWHDYEVLRMPEMPQVEVHLIDSGARPLGGTGEIGPVTVIPALTNALFEATGKRIRSLPLRRHGFHIAFRGDIA